LSLDASERYKRPASSPRKINRHHPKQNSNGVSIGSGGGGGRSARRFADLFAINASTRRFAAPDGASARFRKMYKRVWSILFPLMFLGFCIFYFMAYFALPEDKTLTKCQF